MRKVVGFFALAGLISLPLIAGLAVSVATSHRSQSQAVQTSGRLGLQGAPVLKASEQSR